MGTIEFSLLIGAASLLLAVPRLADRPGRRSRHRPRACTAFKVDIHYPNAIADIGDCHFSGSTPPTSRRAPMRIGAANRHYRPVRFSAWYPAAGTPANRHYLRLRALLSAAISGRYRKRQTEEQPDDPPPHGFGDSSGGYPVGEGMQRYQVRRVHSFGLMFVAQGSSPACWAWFRRSQGARARRSDADPVQGLHRYQQLHDRNRRGQRRAFI